MLLPVAHEGLTDEDLDRVYAWPDWPVPTAWLRANMVTTADGAARSPDGLSAGISSDADRRVFGRLRGLADVVLAGAGTVRAEGYKPAKVKPEFADRRAAAHQTPVPAIAVVSRSLELDLGSVVPSMAGPKRPEGRIALGWLVTVTFPLPPIRYHGRPRPLGILRLGSPAISSRA